jgi:hypothetical protein
VYRSKTEAMFALILDASARLQKDIQIHFYEPTFLKTDGGYVPDFMIIRLVPTTYGYDDFFTATTVCEVKPSMPSDSYFNYLQNIYKNYSIIDSNYHINFYSLFVFNPYRRICLYSIFDYDTLTINKEMETPKWFKDEYFDFALNYRFDLKR